MNKYTAKKETVWWQTLLSDLFWSEDPFLWKCKMYRIFCFVYLKLCSALLLQDFVRLISLPHMFFSVLARTTISFHFLSCSSGTWNRHLFEVRGHSGAGLQGPTGTTGGSLYVVPIWQWGILYCVWVSAYVYSLMEILTSDFEIFVFYFFLLPFRWTPRSCSLVLRQPSSLWGLCKWIQPSLNYFAVCTRAKMVITVPSVRICSQTGRKVPIIFYL